MSATPLFATASHAGKLVLPAVRTSMHSVTLPPTPAHRMQAALAGALEEQLLDDPADLHFALAPNAQEAMKSGLAFDVMICDKAWLKATIDRCKAEGRLVTAIVPEDRSLQAEGWNLAQFDFAPQSAWQTSLQTLAKNAWSSPEWRWARIGFVALIAVQLIGINLWAWRDRADLAAKQAQINQLLLDSYPQTPAVIDAPAQMKRALLLEKAQRGGQDAQSFESQLASKAIVGKAYNQIDYANGELKLTEQTSPAGVTP